MPSPRTRQTVAAALILVLVLAGCSRTVPEASPGSTAPNQGTGNAAQLDWQSCESDFECATLEVPLSWDDPDGDTIELALIRKLASGSDPVGSLLMNPGGPGEPGTQFLPMFLQTGTFPSELLDRFHLVSWDPRGTGDSAGIACLTESDFTDPEPLIYPPSAEVRAELEAEFEDQLQRCLDEHGEVIVEVGTSATVADLDAIRVAVGDDALSYVGFSYGTTIGLEYLRTFPDRVRAVVLDGVALPGTDPVTSTKDQMASFEDNIDRFLDECAADSSCRFGGEDPRATLLAFLDRLAGGERIEASYSLPDESGVRHDREGTLGHVEAVTGIAAALYQEATWTLLRSGLTMATRAENPDGGTLLMLRDLLTGRQLDGTWNHSTEARQAINCADQTERADTLFGDPERIEEWAAEMPVFGAFGAAGLPGCHGWPEAQDPLEELSPSQFTGVPGVLVVNSTGDAATPYANAIEAVEVLPEAELLTWEGDDHTSFGSGHACIDDVVVAYLLDRTLPAPGTRCGPGD